MGEATVRAPAGDVAQPQARSHRDGLVAGVLGAAAMVAFVVVAGGVADEGVATALRPLGGGGASLAFGLLLVALASALLGWLFATMLPLDFPTGAASLVGAGYGLVLMALLTAVVLPAVAPGVRGDMSPLGGSWVIAYAIFGAVLGAAPGLVRGRRARAARRRGVLPAPGAGERLPA